MGLWLGPTSHFKCFYSAFNSRDFKKLYVESLNLKKNTNAFAKVQKWEKTISGTEVIVVPGEFQGFLLSSFSANMSRRLGLAGHRKGGQDIDRFP